MANQIESNEAPPHFTKEEVPLLREKACKWVRQGYINSAESVYLRLIRDYPQDPSMPDVKLRLAYITHIKGGTKEQVKAAFEAVAEAHPDTPEAAEALYRAAVVRLRHSESFQGPEPLDDAIEAFRIAASHPNATPQYHALARVQVPFTYVMRFFNARDPEDCRTAIAEFRACVRDFPDQLEIVYRSLKGIGHAYRLLGEYMESEEAYILAANLEWDAPIYAKLIPLHCVANVRVLRGDFAGARQMFQRFLDQVPGETFLEKDINWRKLYLSDYDILGISAIRRSLVDLGLSCLRCGNSERAELLLEEACQEFPEDEEIVAEARTYLAEITEVRRLAG